MMDAMNAARCKTPRRRGLTARSAPRSLRPSAALTRAERRSIPPPRPADLRRRSTWDRCSRSPAYELASSRASAAAALSPCVRVAAWRMSAVSSIPSWLAAAPQSCSSWIQVRDERELADDSLEPLKLDPSPGTPPERLLAQQEGGSRHVDPLAFIRAQRTQVLCLVEPEHRAARSSDSSASQGDRQCDPASSHTATARSAPGHRA
jgi:hypothetical protein